jgi:hypothetical protein
MMQTVREQLVEALPEPHKLDTLAQWLDLDDVAQRRAGHDEVQQDLRRWASLATAALDRARAEPEKK